MKTGLRFYDRNVIENNTTTVVIEKACICIDDVEGLSNAFRMIPAINHYIKSHPLYREDDFGRPNIVITGKGISKCNPDDSYNRRTGFNLADTRAQKDIFDKAHNFYIEIAGLIETYFYNDISSKIAKTGNSVYKCISHEYNIGYGYSL